jgi:DNA-directed RNA polymerase specialized sigma24 family protein
VVKLVLDGYSQAETAKILGITENAVWQRLNKVRARKVEVLDLLGMKS